MKKRTIIIGSITPALLIITGAFTIIIYGFLFLLSLQLDFSHRQAALEKSLNIAEAGINYYAWHLAHNPNDYQDGTGQSGSYVHEYTDPEGEVVGSYSLTIDPPEDGSSVVTIHSTGWTKEMPNIERSIVAQYGIPSLANFAFLSNASNWYGSGTVVNGQVHSNNGIRMDGTNTAIISSAKDTYKCGQETGCHPPAWKPGVWGSGGDQGLWRFPVSAIDFDTVSVDYDEMKQEAEAEGIYLESSGRAGYHLIFNNDDTLSLYEVRQTDFVRGYSVPGQGFGKAGKGGCEKLYQEIKNETFLQTYDLSGISIIFIEDDVWVEGVIGKSITLASVTFPITSSSTTVWIPNNLTYDSYDGSASFGLITQSDIYINRDVPDDFKLDGVFIAQNGKLIRHGYFDWCGDETKAVKQKITVNGSIISYFKSYWNFGTGPESGFIETEINYDTNLLVDPPPYFPGSGGYEFISWTEEK